MSLSRTTILKSITICLIALSCAKTASAQMFDFFSLPFGGSQQPQQRRPSVTAQQRSNVSLYYNTTFDYYFDNREFDAGNELFNQSQTLNSARVSPQIGIQVNQNQRLQHRVVIGLDIMKNNGENPLTTNADDQHMQNWDMFREMPIFYQVTARTNRSLIEGYAGVFPRRYSGAEWSRAFISDSLKFYDNNLEGFMLKISQPRFYFEIGLDWNGKYGAIRRESFLTFSEAKYLIAKNLELGVDLNYHHLACSDAIPGVIDNGLLEPFVKLDLSDHTPLDYFSIKAGYYQAFQNDRARFHKYVFPAAAEVTLDIMKWNVGIENILLYGSNLMPYYNDKDILGRRLGAQLYYGSPFYQNRLPAMETKAALSDRFEMYYRPHISSFIDLNLALAFIFNGQYSGSRQVFSICFDLEKLYSRTVTSKSIYNTRNSSTARRSKAERPTPKGLQVL